MRPVNVPKQSMKCIMPQRAQATTVRHARSPLPPSLAATAVLGIRSFLLISRMPTEAWALVGKCEAAAAPELVLEGEGEGGGGDFGIEEAPPIVEIERHMGQ